MPIARTFLDWSKPALPAVGEWLIERYGGDQVTDLSGVIVVLTGRRACRRLIEILVHQTDGRLIPPRTITEGEFPEQLYEPQRPFAGELVQRLAWAEAVRRMPRPQAEQVLREVPDDGDVEGWMALGELLWRLHRELAAELLDFGDVLRAGQNVAGFNELRRWESLRVAQQEYLGLLDGLELWDPQTARIVAVDRGECQAKHDIVLVGTVDLNRSTRAMLDQERVVGQVTALIHAPPSVAGRFDEYGCLRPEQWIDFPIALSREQVHVVDRPLDQADEVVRVLAGFDGKYRADEITVGLADDSLVPQIRRRLSQYGVASRWPVGKPLPQTAVWRLLESVATYIESDRADHFADLARHPDIAAWFGRQGVGSQWLQELDDYLSRRLPQRLGDWQGTFSSRVRRAHKLVTQLLADFRGEARPLTEWSDVLLSMLRRVIGERSYDPLVASEKMELEAVARLKETLEKHAEIPESLLPVVHGAQALRLTIDKLSAETVPPMPDDSAVELAGWLDLPLDDSPVLMVTSFNDEFVPSSMGADLFLPNRLRQQLGVMNNDRRYARDAYALCTMLASRERVVLISGRSDLRGDPLLPSRLYFACDPAEAALRVIAFYESLTAPALPSEGPHPPSAEGPGLMVPCPQVLAEPISTISVTAFRDYIACPYRFYLKHVLRLDGVLRDVDEMDGGAFGTLIHQVLGEFGGSEIKASTSADEIREFLRSRVDVWADRAYGCDRLPAVSVQIEQVRRRLDAFAPWQAKRTSNGWRIHYAESPVKRQEDRLMADFPIGNGRSITLQGRIDRIDHNDKTGEWAILDYKTGDAADRPEKAHRRKGEWVDLQLPLYRHLAPALDVNGTISLGYITLPRDTNDVRERMAEWSPDDLAAADQMARTIAALIADGQFLPLGDPPPFADAFTAICQDEVFERRLPE